MNYIDFDLIHTKKQLKKQKSLEYLKVLVLEAFFRLVPTCYQWRVGTNSMKKNCFIGLTEDHPGIRHQCLPLSLLVLNGRYFNNKHVCYSNVYLLLQC